MRLQKTCPRRYRTGRPPPRMVIDPAQNHFRDHCMTLTPWRNFWPETSRTRQTQHGLVQERWHWTLKNHRGNVVDRGSRWLISGLEPQAAAGYLASWWVAEGDRRPTEGWEMRARPARRTQRGVAAVPASLMVGAGGRDESLGEGRTGFGLSAAGMGGVGTNWSVPRQDTRHILAHPVGRARVNATTCPPQMD